MNVVYSLKIIYTHRLTLSHLGYCLQLFGPWGYRKRLLLRGRRIWRGARWWCVLLFLKKNLNYI